MCKNYSMSIVINYKNNLGTYLKKDFFFGVVPKCQNNINNLFIKGPAYRRK